MCEVCGSGKHTVLLSRPFLDPSVWSFIETYYKGRVLRNGFEGAAYEIAECSSCGFLWQRQVLNDEGMRLLYEEWISPKDSREKRLSSDKNLFAGYARSMLLVQQFFPQMSPRSIRVLDYGAGWGSWSLMAKAFGMDSSAYEISGERLGFMNAQGINTYCSLEDLPLEGFHFINSEQCFEHVTQPRRLLSTLVSHLAPGGIVYLAVPDAKRSLSRVRSPGWTATKDAFHPLEHVSIYTHESLIRLAKEAGLEPATRPHFPLCGSAKDLLHGFIAPWYFRLGGTSLYFRRPA